MTHLEKIGSAIRQARETRCLSLGDLATISGIDKPELSRIESGKRNVTIATLVRIVDALGYEMDITFSLAGSNPA
jgi:DNA adenine methylase